jgi:hypothetical protein
MGRPPKNDVDRRSTQIVAKVTEAEKTSAEAWASHCQMTSSDFARTAILEKCWALAAAAEAQKKGP